MLTQHPTKAGWLIVTPEVEKLLEASHRIGMPDGSFVHPLHFRPVDFGSDDLELARVWALEQVDEWDDQAVAEVGIIVRKFSMVARYSANAFEVLDWIALGRPEEPDPLLFPAAAEEAAAYADTSRPGFTIAQMLAEWETRWRAMRLYDQFRGHRRRAIERIRAAESIEEIAMVLADLS